VSATPGKPSSAQGSGAKGSETAGSGGKDSHPAQPDAPLKPDILERGSTILVVEDEVLIRMAVADFLRDGGYRVLEASNAAEAQKVMATAEPIALVFTDITMPGAMDGLGLAAWIRRQYPAVEIILTSGVASRVPTAKQAGAFVDKPYSYEALIAQIHRLLAR
jgi:CheY-like chemotaxis protein